MYLWMRMHSTCVSPSLLSLSRCEGSPQSAKEVYLGKKTNQGSVFVEEREKTLLLLFSDVPLLLKTDGRQARP